MNRPVILLDVDGVLNPMPQYGSVPNDNWPDWQRSMADGFTLWTSAIMASKIAALGDVHWLTTWNEDDAANKMLSPLLGIGPFPVAASPSDRLVFGDEYWKPRAAAQFAEKHSHVIWIDDEANILWREWRDKHPPSNMLLVTPDFFNGFSEFDLDIIGAWLSARS